MKAIDVTFSKWDLINLDTIEQSWSGDELKIQEDDYKVWLTHRDNRGYDGDYTVELLVNGRWEGQSFLFL